MAISAPYLPYEELRRRADEFLRKHHPSGILPVPIERIIEFDFKLDIVPMPGLLDNFEVDAFITSDLSEIRVDRFIQEKRPKRYRFSLAHELAHLLVHRDVFRELTFSTIEEWKEVLQSIPEYDYRWIEQHAYNLAGLILVPAKPLKDRFEDCVAAAAKAGIEWSTLDDRMQRPILDNIGRTPFDVSADVIKKRLKFDKLEG
jgi:hypothetical protein